MTTLIAIYLVLLSAFLCVRVLYQHLRGTHELVSLRNMFTAGFIVFQLTSAVPAMRGVYNNNFPLSDPGGTGLKYALMSTVFLVILMLCYNHGLGARRAAQRTPASRAVPEPVMLWIAMLILTCAAGVLRFGVLIPYVGILAQLLAVAVGASAAGLAGWVWSRRLLNPYVAIPALGIVGINSLIAISGAFGRRELLAVGGGMLWGMWFGHFRYLPVRTSLPRLAAIAILPLTALALYTAVRDPGEHDRTAGQHLQAMAQSGNVLDGLTMMATGQDAGRISMWLVENHRDRFEQRPLFTLWYLAVYPVPRQMWPDKPEPLSVLIPAMANMKKVNVGLLTMGGGIIGQSAAEGGWYAIVIYAAFFGALLRYFDELARVNAINPFVVVPVASAVGQVIGLPRGEVAAFTFVWLFSVGVSSVLLIVTAKAIEMCGLAHPVPEDPSPDYDDPDAADAGYEDSPHAAAGATPWQ